MLVASKCISAKRGLGRSPFFRLHSTFVSRFRSVLEGARVLRVAEGVFLNPRTMCVAARFRTPTRDGLWGGSSFTALLGAGLVASTPNLAHHTPGQSA